MDEICSENMSAVNEVIIPPNQTPECKDEENDNHSDIADADATNNDEMLAEELSNDVNEEKNKKKPSKRKQTFERKKIRNIMDDENFCQDAKDAQKAEAERLKRVKEKEYSTKMLKLLTNENLKFGPRPQMGSLNLLGTNYVARLPKFHPAIQNLQLRKSNINKMYRVIPDDKPINLDMSDDDDDDLYPDINLIGALPRQDKKFEVIEISDGEEGDDDIDEVLDQESLDIKNFLKDDKGRVLINTLHPEEEDDYFLSDKISSIIKPHQVSGIRFLYNNLVESKKEFKESEGFGCILAHSMGLGKTVQIIGFLDILFRCVEAKSALVIVPINTIQNWQSEIDFWLPSQSDSNTETSNSSSIRPFRLFVIRDSHKTVESRHVVIKEWLDKGGVLLIGYEMFRLLVTYRKNSTANKQNHSNTAHTNNLLDSLNNSNRKNKKKEQKSKKKVCIDIDLEEKRDGYYQDFLKALIDPGPEVVICDEGHRIKNSEASISKALKSIKTHRRVVMTGYPLQNNLTEYWCMVDFVRPNYLGSKTDFNNMFQRPIENGQCVDSTFEDRKLMQGRAHVLHELLQGFVQRRSHAVLKASLPPKWEYVIVVKMSDIQRKLYSTFMDAVINGTPYMWQDCNVLKTYAMCCKIWNHPDILYKLSKEEKTEKIEPDFDFDIEDDLTTAQGGSKPASSTTSNSQKTANTRSTKKRVYQPLPPNYQPTTSVTKSSTINTDQQTPSVPVISDENSEVPSLQTPELTTKEDGSDSSMTIPLINTEEFLNKHPSNTCSLIKDIPQEVLQQNPAKFMSYTEYMEVFKNQIDGVSMSKEENSSFSWLTDDIWYLNDTSATNDDVKQEKTSDQNNSDESHQPTLKEYVTECKENGGKIVIFLSLLEECLKFGDKMLVFSQSLLTLDLLELFLKQSRTSDGSEWVKNKTYFRLDGSTSAPERERMITTFNADSKAELFLLSTRAGCLGINLIGANRVIVFDASWNPCHDCQAVCRVYRYGQVKPCFIYRLITENTIEKKIYDRQVKKQGISDRVVDESNPSQQFTKSQVEVLIEYKDEEIPSLNEEDIVEIRNTCSEEDPVLGRILERHRKLITKIPFTHESLLIDQKSYRLTKREKRKAKERYEMDKRQSIYYSKNNYSEFYVKTTVPVADTFSGINKLVNSSVGPSNVSLRSSIIPNYQFQNNHVSAPPNAPNVNNPSSFNFRLNRQFSRPQRIIRPHNALLRELEQARMRCGFNKQDSATSTPTVQMPAPNLLQQRRSLLETIASNKEKLVDLTSEERDISEPSNKTRKVESVPESDKPNNSASHSLIKNTNNSEKSAVDKEVKIVKIKATTEMPIPTTTTISTSDVGGSNNKINVGDDLEIIYSKKGKYLRVCKTGDLFAIKGGGPNPTTSSLNSPTPTTTSTITKPTSLPKPIPISTSILQKDQKNKSPQKPNTTLKKDGLVSKATAQSANILNKNTATKLNEISTSEVPLLPKLNTEEESVEPVMKTEDNQEDKSIQQNDKNEMNDGHLPHSNDMTVSKQIVSNTEQANESTPANSQYRKRSDRKKNKFSKKTEANKSLKQELSTPMDTNQNSVPSTNISNNVPSSSGNDNVVNDAIISRNTEVSECNVINNSHIISHTFDVENSVNNSNENDNINNNNNDSSFNKNVLNITEPMITSSLSTSSNPSFTQPTLIPAQIINQSPVPNTVAINTAPIQSSILNPTTLITMPFQQQIQPLPTTTATNNNENITVAAQLPQQITTNIICCTCKYNGPLIYIPGCMCQCHSSPTTIQYPQFYQPATNTIGNTQLYAINYNNTPTITQTQPVYYQNYVMNGTTNTNTIYTHQPITSFNFSPQSQPSNHQSAIVIPQTPQASILFNNSVCDNTKLSSNLMNTCINNTVSNNAPAGFQFSDL